MNTPNRTQQLLLPVIGILVLVVCVLFLDRCAEAVNGQIIEAEDKYDKARASEEARSCEAILGAVQYAKEAVSSVEPIGFLLPSAERPEYPAFVALLQAVSLEEFNQKSCGRLRAALEQDVLDYYNKAKDWGTTEKLSAVLCALSPNHPENRRALSRVLKAHEINYDPDECTPQPPTPTDTPEIVIAIATPHKTSVPPTDVPTYTPAPTPTPTSPPEPISINMHSVSFLRLPRGECSADENNIAAIDQMDSKLQITGTAAVSNLKSQEDAFDYFELWVKREQDDSGSYRMIVKLGESKKDTLLTLWDWKSYGFKSGDSINLRLWVYRKNGQHSDPGCIVEFNIP